MFDYDWNRFDAKLGLIFMVSTLLVFSLMGRFDFAIYAAAISALLAWITVTLVPNQSWRQHIWGLVAYLVVGVPLTWLAHMVAPYQWAMLTSLAGVTFAAYMLLLKGAHPFMTGWCLAYWYLLLPLFLVDQTPVAVSLGHVVGAGLVIALNLLKPVWSRASLQTSSTPPASSDQPPPPVGYVIRFAAIVSLSIVAGAITGIRWVSSDPTVIANATMNMISPSLLQTWAFAVERIVLGFVGIIGGFYFGWYFADPWVTYAVTAVCSFLALAVIHVNMALLVGIVFFLISYQWGGMQSEAGHVIANEKLLGELVGVALAVVAIAILVRLSPGGDSPEAE
jgi:hypothetical protein